jgi:hypothetical protein
VAANDGVKSMRGRTDEQDASPNAATMTADAHAQRSILVMASLDTANRDLGV